MRTIEKSQQAPFTKNKEWFAAFSRNTNQKRVQYEATLYGLQERFPYIWERILNSNYNFKVLYVGAGAGGVEIPLTRHFKKSRRTGDYIDIYCVDPSLQMREEFYATARSAVITPMVKKYDLQTFEDDNFHPPDVDFALASHVWYYVNKWKDVPIESNSLAKFVATVGKRKGISLITLQSETSDNYLIRSKQSPRIHGTKERYGEEVTYELARLSIDYQAAIIESYTDVRSCFRRGVFNPNEEGKLLLSFILRAPWDVQSSETQQQVSNDLSEIVNKNREERMVFRDLYMWMG